MRVSAEKLASEANATGFRPDMLEKVAHLLGLLDALRAHPDLRGKLALKGGTALNLFVHDLPRLSVDIDLNYVGAKDREGMLAERPLIEEAIQAVFRREDIDVRRMPPDEHAGGKWSLRYPSASGGSGNVEVDLNFMFRIPMWPVTTRDSHAVGSWRATGIPVLDVHELAAGKLAALFARRLARDLFDVHRILRMESLDRERLRIGFVVYGAMNRKDWRTVSVDDVRFDEAGFGRQLIPLLRADAVGMSIRSAEYGAQLVAECRERLSLVLPFDDHEIEFLRRLNDAGEIAPELLTTDANMRVTLREHPGLRWKALNVRKHRGLDAAADLSEPA